jgi:hypothetical protein
MDDCYRDQWTDTAVRPKQVIYWPNLATRRRRRRRRRRLQSARHWHYSKIMLWTWRVLCVTACNVEPFLKTTRCHNPEDLDMTMFTAVGTPNSHHTILSSGFKRDDDKPMLVYVKGWRLPIHLEKYKQSSCNITNFCLPGLFILLWRMLRFYARFNTQRNHWPRLYDLTHKTAYLVF